MEVRKWNQSTCNCQCAMDDKEPWLNKRLQSFSVVQKCNLHCRKRTVWRSFVCRKAPQVHHPHTRHFIAEGGSFGINRGVVRPIDANFFDLVHKHMTFKICVHVSLFSIRVAKGWTMSPVRTVWFDGRDTCSRV